MNWMSEIRSGMNRKMVWLEIVLAILLFFINSLCASAQADGETTQIAVSYCAVECASRPIMAEYSDKWLLAPPNEFNQKLMQVSFVMAASAFRDNTHDLDQRDFNILDFFSRAGYSDPRTDDYNKVTSINTIGSAIAHKKIGEATVIAVAMSGNNYANEWLNNFTVSDEQRSQGFNDAAVKVFERIREYIRDHSLTGELRLWITGYSRAAAIANITAADATDSGLFTAVYGYTIGTPRTTKDQDAERFDNIFNVINPFDPIPLMPFPEWGYRRYGTDLYLPSMETDSDYFIKKYAADSVSMQVTGVPVRFNPQVNAQLHTILDFLLFYVRSSNSYKENFQNGIIQLWESREYEPLLQGIAEKIEQLGDVTIYQLREFYAFLDYLCQVLYTSFRGQKFHPDDLYWNPGLSLQENFMHEHYDSAYLSWIFSSDNPGKVYSDVPKYTHYTILGDVDIELFDSQGRFIEKIARDGSISTDPAVVRTAGFTGGQSSAFLYAERSGKRTLIILPKDQTFSAVIYSHKDQEVRYSLVDYSADAIQANVRYIYYENLKANTFSEGVTDLFVVENLSANDLTERGFFVVEPWTNDTVYSPSAVMKLENADVFHPAPLALLTFSGLILAMTLYILYGAFAGTKNVVKAGVQKVRKAHKSQKAGKKKKTADTAMNHAKIESSNPESQGPAEDKHHENQ